MYLASTVFEAVKKRCMLIVMVSLLIYQKKGKDGKRGGSGEPQAVVDVTMM